MMMMMMVMVVIMVKISKMMVIMHINLDDFQLMLG